MRWIGALLWLVGCDLSGLGDTTCDGRAWDGGGSLIDAGASLEKPTSDWVAGLDDASLDGPGASFAEASCAAGQYSVQTDMDGDPDEVMGAVWNLAERSLGEPVPLKAVDDGWAGDVPGPCAADNVSTVIAMPSADGVFGGPSGSKAGDITGWGTINGSGAATNVEVYTADNTDLVELLVLDLMNGTAAGPTPLKRGEGALGQTAWEVPDKDRVCREDGDFLIFGFIASRAGKVTGAWSL